jgi:hypothetical protein
VINPSINLIIHQLGFWKQTTARNQSLFLLKLKSKQLLEIAKIGVEKAIETDEAIATDWINQQSEIC